MQLKSTSSVEII